MKIYFLTSKTELSSDWWNIKRSLFFFFC